MVECGPAVTLLPAARCRREIVRTNGPPTVPTSCVRSKSCAGGPNFEVPRGGSAQAMIRLRKPSESDIAEELRTAGAFTYPEVGASERIGTAEAASLEGRYDVDRRCYALGEGVPTFEAARAALLGWRHFEVPWLEFYGGERPAVEDQVVATLVNVVGIWLSNPCRVVRVEDREAREDLVELVYGTLPGHAECGEERFRVAIDPATEIVTYEIAAFSRPAILLAKLGYPFARRLQARFAVASARALAAACSIPPESISNFSVSNQGFEDGGGRMTDFDLQPTLRGERLLLRPLAAEDFDALYAAASDPLIWEQHPDRKRHEPEAFRVFFEEAMASGGALIAIDVATDRVVGSSRYHGPDVARSEVEIGWSFLRRSHCGGAYNGEMKRLMAEHAFRHVKSVVLFISPGNQRSQRAAEKIGAIRTPGLDGQGRCVYRLTPRD